MLEFLGSAIVKMIEKELIEHAPEIQEAIIQQIDNFAKILFDYVQQKGIDASQSSETPKLNDESPKE